MKKSSVILSAVFVFVCALFVFGANGQAYIDPSVMTYVIQAVAGVIIAVGAAVGSVVGSAVGTAVGSAV